LQLVGLAVLTDPLGQLCFVQFPRCSGHDSSYGVHLIGDKAQAIGGQKNTDGEEGDAFVAIYKWMVSEEPECICRCEFGDCRLLVVGMAVLGAGESGIQQPFITQSGSSPEGSQTLFVEQKQDLFAHPAWLCLHFASALKVSRYSFMNSRPALSCSSIDGS